MAKIITVAHQKGGVGKSTLVLNLALSFKQTGLKVAIIDMDLQGSLAGLVDMVDNLDIVLPPDPIEALTSLPYDILLIDTPPYLASVLPKLFSLSNFILIPTKTGFFDAMAIKSTLNLVQEAKRKSPALDSGIVLNMVKNNSTLTNEVKQIFSSERILDTVIYERVSYIRSALTGGIFNTTDKKAKEEITSLTAEIADSLIS